MADLDALRQQFQDSLSRSIPPEAVATQLGLMAGISLATVLAFSALRPNNRVIYEPKSKYHPENKEPPKISKSFFGWLSPLIHVKEPELIDKVGLDATTFLRFLRMMRWLFTALGILGAVALIPGDAITQLRNSKLKNRTVLSILTIQGINGNLVYAHIAASYVFTAIICGFVWIHWKAMTDLRHAWFRSPEYAAQFYARTLQITQVPKKFQSDDGLKAIFDSVQVPYPTTSVHIGRTVGALPELIEYHNNTVRELEKHLVRYLKGNKIGKHRPTIRIGGFLGMGGKKVDAIDYYSERLQKSEAKVQAFRSRIDERKPENYGFASMAAVPYAHIVADLLQSKHPKGTTITLAPNPKDIIWSNLTMSNGAIRSKRTIGFVWLALVAFLNTLPLAIISFLANLSSIAESGVIPALQTLANEHPAPFAVVSGVLPPAVSALFGWALPRIMRALSKYQGGTTHSRLDRAVVARYFAFLVISQLVIFTIIGVLFKVGVSIQGLIKKHASIGDIANSIRSNVFSDIDQAYVEQSSYWLTFFPLRGFLVFFDLAQLINLLWITIKTRLFGRTPRDHRDWTQPPEFEYALYYSNMLFMACVGIVFAPLAPLVTIATAAVFWISSWVYKYQLMFVFISRVETGGRLWNVIMNRILACAVLMQLLLVLTTGIKFGWRSYRWAACIPPIIAVFIFKMVLKRTFDARFRFFKPTEEEIRNARIHNKDERRNTIANRFGHPALHAELFTPMVHAKQIPLLSQVYSGKIDASTSRVKEMGNQKVDTAVVSGGIKFAGIQQADLEYDPRLYQRDRGDMDQWDAKSVMTDFQSIAPSKFTGYEGGRASPAPMPQGFQQYMAQGPGTPRTMKDEYELNRFDSNYDQQPLLAAPGLPYAGSNVSTSSLPGYPQYPGAASTTGMGGDGYREAPLHRPNMGSRDPSEYGASSLYPPSAHQSPRQHDPYAQTQDPNYLNRQVNQGHGYTPSEENMAGRGRTFR